MNLLRCFFMFFSCPLLVWSAGPEDILDTIALIRAGKGVGTGFVVQDGQRSYLYTNTHVLQGGEPLSASTLSGQPFSLGSLQVANKRDLARIELKDHEGPGLLIESTLPVIGSPIAIYGNSDGAGVATKLEGEVLGVGPALLEVNAKFVRGNSGSPILSTDWTVLGIATFAVKYADEQDWLKQDSRFSQIRRYGVRFEGVEWVDMEYVAFHKRAALLADMREMADQLFKILFTDSYNDARNTKVVYSVYSESRKFRNYPGFANEVGAYAREVNGAWEWIQGIRRSANSHNGTRDMQKRRDALRDYKMSQMMTRQKLQKFYAQNRILRQKVHRRLAHDQWGTDYFLEEAKGLYEAFRQLLDTGEDD